MAEINASNRQHENSVERAQQEARTRANEEDRRKQVAGHVEPARTADAAHAGHKAAAEQDPIQAANAEAARTNEAGRQFQQWAQTQDVAGDSARVGASRGANAEETLKVADLQRKRDPAIKG